MQLAIFRANISNSTILFIVKHYMDAMHNSLIMISPRARDSDGQTTSMMQDGKEVQLAGQWSW